MSQISPLKSLSSYRGEWKQLRGEAIPRVNHAADVVGAATIGKRRSTPSASWGSWALLKYFEVLLLLLCTQWHQSDWHETNRADRKPKQLTDRPRHLHAKCFLNLFNPFPFPFPLLFVVALQVTMWLTHTVIVVLSSPTHSRRRQSHVLCQQHLRPRNPFDVICVSVLAWKKPNRIKFTPLSQQGRQLYMPSMVNRLRIESQF